MRSGVLIGVAMAMLTVRLMGGSGEVAEAEPAGARAASAAAGLLAGAAASAPRAAPLPQPAFAVTDAAAGGVIPAPVPPARHAAASQAMRAASVEAEVAALRSRGAGEDAVYRVRAARLAPAEVAQLTAMETAEADWRRQLASTPAGCAAPCAAMAPEHVVASAYRQEATPRLTLE